MPTSSKRTTNQYRQPSAPQDDAYDEYVSQTYYPKSVNGGGYEYVQDRQQSADQYYDEPAPNNSASMQRT